MNITSKEKLKSLTQEELELFTKITHEVISLHEIQNIDFHKLINNLELVSLCSNLYYEAERLDDDRVTKVYRDFAEFLEEKITY